MKWTALTTCADSGPLESLRAMLNSVGIGLLIPNDRLRDQLQRWGLDTILSPDRLEKEMGYSRVEDIPFASLSDLDRDDVLFVDVKAHRNGPRLWRHKPNLKGRTLWYRINGGKPEHVIRMKKCFTCQGDGCHPMANYPRNEERIKEAPCPNCYGKKEIVGEDCGDEVNIPCPILTPNLWYKQEFEITPCPVCGDGTPPPKSHSTLPGSLCDQCGDRGVLSVQMPWRGKSFACWPPFARLDEYDPRRRPGNGIDHYYKKYSNPLCLIHNCTGWGYGKTLEPMRGLGVRVHGQGSPDGLLQHGEARVRLETALAMVHLKSSDAPGYAIYEALASGCPLICPRRLIWRNRMRDLLVEGETCLCFDRETHDSLTDEEAASCTAEVAGHLRALSNHDYNQKIGNAGRKRLEEVMWSSKKESDVNSLRDFMERNFP